MSSKILVSFTYLMDFEEVLHVRLELAAKLLIKCSTLQQIREVTLIVMRYLRYRPGARQDSKASSSVSLVHHPAKDVINHVSACDGKSGKFRQKLTLKQSILRTRVTNLLLTGKQLMSQSAAGIYVTS